MVLLTRKPGVPGCSCEGGEIIGGVGSEPDETKSSGFPPSFHSRSFQSIASIREVVLVVSSGRWCLWSAQGGGACRMVSSRDVVY